VAWSRVATVRRVLLAGLALSLGIELAQLGISLLVGTWYRMSDVDDVLLNVLGVYLGWLSYRVGGRLGGP
jgi:glycopeptide antibiotics resistance protein